MAMSEQLLVIDEGTSSTRAMLVDGDGRTSAMAQREVPTHYPQPGWVEQDAEQIWQLTLEAAREAVGDQVNQIAAIGITNQRETIVFWDRVSRSYSRPPACCSTPISAPLRSPGRSITGRNCATPGTACASARSTAGWCSSSPAACTSPMPPTPRARS